MLHESQIHPFAYGKVFLPNDLPRLFAKCMRQDPVGPNFRGIENNRGTTTHSSVELLFFTISDEAGDKTS